MDWQRVPQAWSSSRKTPVAETVIGTLDDAHRCVGRSESVRAHVGSKLTVVCQIRRCLASQTLEDQDGDLEGHSLTLCTICKNFKSTVRVSTEKRVKILAGKWNNSYLDVRML